jgi:putative hemolysin
MKKEISTKIGLLIINIIAIVAVFVIIIADRKNQDFFKSFSVPMAHAAKKSTATQSEKTSVGIANPASTNCIEKGGKLTIKTEKDGGQVGYCLLENGKECEEWQYFRGECS